MIGSIILRDLSWLVTT